MKEKQTNRPILWHWAGWANAQRYDYTITFDHGRQRKILNCITHNPFKATCRPCKENLIHKGILPLAEDYREISRGR
jgi:hypothetical protein